MSEQVVPSAVAQRIIVTKRFQWSRCCVE